MRYLSAAGMVDVNAQQVDLRPVNSWMLKLDEVESPELAEVFVINAMAPFVLNSKLKPLMLKGRTLPPGIAVCVGWNGEQCGC